MTSPTITVKCQRVNRQLSPSQEIVSLSVVPTMAGSGPSKPESGSFNLVLRDENQMGSFVVGKSYTIAFTEAA